MKIKIYVESGGERKDSKLLKIQCRKAFSKFFEKAGFIGRMPSIIACGSRDQAFRDFKLALSSSNDSWPVLLVDSESAVKSDSAWDHLKIRDKWARPKAAADEQVHLMVQCMESWFMADKQSLENYFGKGFNSSALPRNPNIEEIPKQDLFRSLKSATANCQKGGYHKGKHAFVILEGLNPHMIRQASLFAERLIQVLERMSS